MGINKLIDPLRMAYNKYAPGYKEDLGVVADYAKEKAAPVTNFISNAPIVKAASEFLDNPTPQELGQQVANIGGAFSESAQQFVDDFRQMPIVGGTIVGRGTRGISLAGQKIFRGDPTPISLEKFNPNAGVEAGKELGQSMAEGPGIYFTTSPKNAKSYGRNITSANISIGSKIIDANEPKFTKSKIEKIISDLDKDTLDGALSNWDENPIVAKRMLVDAIHANPSAQDQLMSIWSDVFYHQNPEAYMDLMAKHKIAGIEVPKSGLSHFVIYDKKSLYNVKAEDFLDD